MKRCCRVLGILSLVVACLVATAPPAVGASVIHVNFTLPTVSKTTYSISGNVLKNATSAPVQNVEVEAVGTLSQPFSYGSALTSASGDYSISHLLPGTYHIQFKPPRTTNLQSGYRNSTAPGGYSATTPNAVTITTASQAKVNVRLPLGFEITGKVTRSDGTTAIPGAWAYATGAHHMDYTQTDASGNYTLMGLSPDTYKVTFEHDSSRSNQTGCYYSGAASKFSASCTANTNVVISTASVSGISPKIPNSLSVTGYVKTRASTPAPIANAFVVADGPVVNSGNTDATGKYTIAGLNPGSYTIAVRGPDGSSVPDGYYYATSPYYWAKTTASAAKVSLFGAKTTLRTIEPPTGYFIRGKITSTSGTDVSGVWLEAAGGTGTLALSLLGTTDASGNYSIGPVPPNTTYTISAGTTNSSSPSLQSGWYLNSPPNNFTAASASALALYMTGDKPGIDMRLPTGASISGTVTMTGGAHCAYCEVHLISQSGVDLLFTRTSSSGAYMLQGLPAGSYRVEAFPNGNTIVDATHVLVASSGYYKSGAAPNYSATLAGATALSIAP